MQHHLYAGELHSLMARNNMIPDLIAYFCDFQFSFAARLSGLFKYEEHVYGKTKRQRQEQGLSGG